MGKPMVEYDTTRQKAIQYEYQRDYNARRLCVYFNRLLVNVADKFFDVAVDTDVGKTFNSPL